MIRPMMLILLFAILTLSIPPVFAESVLTLSEDKMDFGYAPQSAKIAHVFWLYATGDQPVKIAEVKPGCGCTQAPLEKDYLEPGDSTRLEIVFSTGRYANRTAKRPAIMVEGQPEPISIDIVAYVLPRADSIYPLTLNPCKLDLSQYGATVRDRASLKITNISDRDMAIRMVSGPVEFGTVTVPEKIGAGETVEVELVLNETSVKESFEKSFTFELDDEHNSRYTIPVKRRYHDPNAATLTAP
jgi:hypothetical protein